MGEPGGDCSSRDDACALEGDAEHVVAHAADEVCAAGELADAAGDEAELVSVFVGTSADDFDDEE